MDKEYITGNKVWNTKVNGWMIKNMVMVFTLGMMVEVMKVTSVKILNKGMVFIFLPMVKDMKVIG